MVDPPESLEQLAAYGGTEPERLSLVRTVVAMANTRGGRVRIAEVRSGRRDLDPPALAALVNRFAGPTIAGIETADLPGGGALVTVPESESRPHVMIESGRFRAGDEEGTAFHRGQVWVRHASGDVEATPDDLQAILFDAAGSLLERIGAQIRKPGFILHEGDATVQPVRLVSDPSAPLVRADVDALFPLTRQKLCDHFGKPYAWIAAAARRLGVEESRELSYADRNAAGHPTRWRYAEGVRDLIAKRLRERPDWDPIHEE